MVLLEGPTFHKGKFAARVFKKAICKQKEFKLISILWKHFFQPISSCWFVSASVLHSVSFTLACSFPGQWFFLVPKAIFSLADCGENCEIGYLFSYCMLDFCSVDNCSFSNLGVSQPHTFFFSKKSSLVPLLFLIIFFLRYYTSDIATKEQSMLLHKHNVCVSYTSGWVSC